MSVKRLLTRAPLAGAALLIAWALAAVAAAPEPAGTYAGAPACKACHFQQFRTWSKSKHATNFSVLRESEQKNPECLKCHTTGYGRPSGFASVEKTPALTNTGCEACHGPGSAHVEAAKNAPATGTWDKKIPRIIASSCIQCHNPHVNQKERIAAMRGEL